MNDEDEMSEAEVLEAVRGLLRRQPDFVAREVRHDREAREAPIQPTDLRARDIAQGFGAFDRSLHVLLLRDGATAKQLRDAVRIALDCQHAGAASHDDEIGWCGMCGSFMTRTGPDGAEQWQPPVLLDRLRAALR